MVLRQKCVFCEKDTLAKRIKGFYLGADEQILLWECRLCLGVWSKKTKGGA
jgi:hypothetical protein